MKLLYFLLIFLFSSTQLIQSQTIADYSKSSAWISQPEIINHKADVFYVYPTIYFSNTPANMQLSDDSLKEKAVGIYKEQASVFENDCNIFAPYYPQMSIAVLNIEGAEFDKHFNIAYSQVKAAFQYYLENLNDGRPFFIAGHSQGSLMILQMMKEKLINEQLIAAYVIGYSVTNEDLKQHPWLKIAQKSNDIGVIITYNTQSPDATGSPVLLEGAHCVNPLNWTTKTTYAADSLNQGAVFFDEKENPQPAILHYTDAQVGSDGALVVSSPNPDDFYVAGKSAFPRGVYHRYDYQFFYRNLQENIRARKNAYFNN
ncbi:MAG: DUF3089 domain-containing protein [Bacteroidetes bacterium]|nr:DUF3089 domain-containing protein [Bacteroidota bacterium]